MAVKYTYEPIYISAAITERATPADGEAAAPSGPRVLHVVASTEAEDSHESILVQNWDLKRFSANPVVLWAHSRNEIPIGTAKAKLIGAKGDPGRKLEADIAFPPPGKYKRADEVWSAWEDGLVRAVSVGFKAHSIRWEKIKDREVLVFDDLELLELSFCPVGSNPETLADARQRALAERAAEFGDTLRGVLVPHADTTPAAAVAAAVQPAAEAATPQEHRMDPKSLARDLGLSEDATEAQIRSAITDTRAAAAGNKALLEATGAATVDAARGVIEAGKAAVVELAKAQARIAEIEAEKAERERSAIIAKLDAEHRISPAQRDGFCKTATIETLRSFAESAPVIVAPSQHREAGTGASATGSTVTHAGKAYEELTGPERIALRDSDKDTFNALRSDWLSRGQPLSKSAG